MKITIKEKQEGKYEPVMRLSLKPHTTKNAVHLIGEAEDGSTWYLMTIFPGGYYVQPGIGEKSWPLDGAKRLRKVDAWGNPLEE